MSANSNQEMHIKESSDMDNLLPSDDYDSDEASTICTDDTSFVSYLCTIVEETEDDLMEYRLDASIDEESTNCTITLPRCASSLDAFLKRDQRRDGKSTIDVTQHASKFGFDIEIHPESRKQSVGSFTFSRRGSMESCASVESFASCDSTFSFKITQRRLQKKFSTTRLRKAIQATTSNEEWNRSDSMRSLHSMESTGRNKSLDTCLNHMAQTLLNSPPPKRSCSGYAAARSRLQAVLVASSIE